MASTLLHELDARGAVIAPAVAAAGAIRTCIAAVSAVEGCARDLLERAPKTRELLHDPAIRDTVREVMGPGAFVVRALFFARAPREILEAMVALRVHLDDCGPGAGPLRIIRGSHRYGLLDAAAIAHHIQHGEHVELCVPAGGLVLMRPLVLHASRRAHVAHRRVVHLELARAPLPPPLEWRSAR